MRRLVASLALWILSLAPIAVPAVTASAASGASWQGQVKKACGAALSRIGDRLPDATPAFESSSDPTFSDLSAADLKGAATFFKVFGATYAALADRLDGITSSKKTKKPYARFVALVEATSTASKKLSQKLEQRTPGDTTDNLRPDLNAAEGGAQLAKNAARQLDLKCPVLDLSRGVAIADESTCYSGPSPADLVETPCDDPHDVELYFSPDKAFGVDTAYPGDDDESGIAEDQCASEFEKFVGIPVDQSAAYTFEYDYPDAKEWAGGDRWLDCYVQAADGTQLTGSAKGAAR
jgi:hypothetical protein